MNTPLFVVGCPRSGTTLVARVLSDTVFGKPTETQFITKYYRKLDAFGDLEVEANFTALAGAILKERAVMQWKLNVTPQDLWNSAPRRDYPGLIDALMTARSADRGYRSWGDKTPHYLLDLDVLYKLYPDSRFVYIVRDGRDVALSLLQKSWGPNNLYCCAKLWKRYNEETPLLSRLEQEGRLFRLRYEDLLDAPEAVSRKLYEFLGERQSDALAAEMGRSIVRKNFDKWKTRLRPRQIRLFEAVAGETLSRFGYETASGEAEVPALTRAFWTSHNAILRALELVRSNTVEYIKIKYFGAEPFAR